MICILSWRKPERFVWILPVILLPKIYWKNLFLLQICAMWKSVSVMLRGSRCYLGNRNPMLLRKYLNRPKRLLTRKMCVPPNSCIWQACIWNNTAMPLIRQPIIMKKHFAAMYVIIMRWDCGWFVKVSLPRQNLICDRRWKHWRNVIRILMMASHYIIWAFLWNIREKQKKHMTLSIKPVGMQPGRMPATIPWLSYRQHAEIGKRLSMK